jgi:hypothetical protein
VRPPGEYSPPFNFPVVSILLVEPIRTSDLDTTISRVASLEEMFQQTDMGLYEVERKLEAHIHEFGQDQKVRSREARKFRKDLVSWPISHPLRNFTFSVGASTGAHG